VSSAQNAKVELQYNEAYSGWETGKVTATCTIN
jgi:hypothetical protein